MAIGEKVATVMQAVGTGVTAIVIAFVNGWLMTIVILASIPLLFIAGYFYMKTVQTKSKQF